MPKPVVEPQDMNETVTTGPGSTTGRGQPRSLTVDDVAVPETSANPLLAAINTVKPIELAAPRREAPVFDGAVAIYVGSHPKRSVSLRGVLAVTSIQEWSDVEQKVVTVTHKAVPEAGGDGTTSYDFSLRDSVGRLIQSRLVPVGHPYLGQYANKPMQLVEHPDHLFQLFQMRAPGGGQEFVIVCPPERQRELESYFLARARGARAEDEMVTSVIEHATASA